MDRRKVLLGNPNWLVFRGGLRRAVVSMSYGWVRVTAIRAGTDRGLALP